MMSARSASARKMMDDSKTVRSTKSTRTLRQIRSDRQPDPFALGFHGAGFGFHADLDDPPPLPTTNAYFKTSDEGKKKNKNKNDNRLNGTSTRSDRSSSNGAPSDLGDYRRSDPQLLDKRSGGGLRKGLAKTFGFGGSKKDKDFSKDWLPERPASSATTRPASLNQPVVNDGFDFDSNRPTRPRLASTTISSLPSPSQLSPTSPQYSSVDNPITMTGAIVPGGLPRPGPPPTTKLPAVPPSNPGPQIKRYAGAGRPPSRWSKLRRDPELWDPHGDVLVYFSHPTQGENPNLRISSRVIEATRNLYLIKLLRDSFVQENPQHHGLPFPHNTSGSGSRAHRSHYHSSSSSSSFAGGQPTPPMSEADDNTTESDVSYEMYLPPPPCSSRTDLIRHQVTTRNVFALLYTAPQVGISLYQAISDVHIRLEKYYSQSEYHPPGESQPADVVVNYLASRRLDDVRGSAEAAVAILAWAETPGVYWSAGWREAFIHAAGMSRRELESCPNWRFVAPLTRALLERSSLEMALRVQAVEERLAEFSFEDMWSGSSSPAALGWGSSLASPLAAAGRFRNFLISHYARAFGSWPPPPPPPPPPPSQPASDPSSTEGHAWLTRSVMKSLQQDFGALYEYIVDQDVIWDVSEARAGRKWMMVSRGNKAFEADMEGMPTTDILIGFDNRQRIPLPHLENPYPLLPQSIPSPGDIYRANRIGGQEPIRHQKRERMVALAYTESTNIDSLEITHSPTSLVDAFARFEKEDHVSDVDPQMARLGRWVLLYGILQVLAPISADAPGVSYSDGVDYHLSAKVKKPSWSRDANMFVDATHTDSYCWQVSRKWQRQVQQQAEDDKMTPLEMFPLPMPPIMVRERPPEMGGLRESHATSFSSFTSFMRYGEEEQEEDVEVPKDLVSYNMTRPLTPLIRDFDSRP